MILTLDLNRNIMSPKASVLVLGFSFVRSISHGRVAKKYPPISRSTAWWSAELIMVDQDFAPSRDRCLRKSGVIARCRFGGLDTASNAFSSEDMEGSNWELCAM